MDKTPRLIRFLFIFAAVATGVLSLLRVAFFLAFNNPDDPVGGADLAEAFYLGLKYDLRVVLILLVPIAALGWLRLLSPFEKRGARLFWTGYITLLTLIVAFFYIVDFGHYAYLSTRVDVTVLRFLSNPDISLEMVWESYPVLWISLGLVVATALVAWSTHRLFARLARKTPPQLGGWRRAGVGTASFFIILFGLYGKISYYPLRWSDAYFSTHTFASALAANPIHYFIDTYRNGGVRYDEKKVRAAYPVLQQFLKLPAPDAARLSFDRTGGVRGEKRFNVVLVQIESFAWYRNSLSGNPLDPTPHFAKMAREGMYFDNFYVPHTGTAHAVFATITGIPDVEQHGTSTRNPVIVDQHTIIDDFAGYRDFYFLGGSASWGNIRGVLSHNIPGLKIYEEGSYQAPRVDVWGISDLSLFEAANQVLRQQDKPFFAYIQTSGGHRPYTIPEDHRGFEIKHPGDDVVKKYGFESEAEYNSYRFMDHAIGWFIDHAKKEKYFANTVFVFFGDHGIAGNAGEHVSAAETQLELGAHHVPFVIYAPGMISPQTNHTLGSQIDVLPTVAALVGQPYHTRTLGRDLLDNRYQDQRYDFIINHSQRRVGVIGDGFVFRMGEDGSNPHLHRIDAKEPRDDVAAAYPEQAAKMRLLTSSIYETAKYMLYHNQHRSAALQPAASGGAK